MSTDSRIKADTVDDRLSIKLLHFSIGIKLIEVAYPYGKVSVCKQFYGLCFLHSHKEDRNILFDCPLLEKNRVFTEFKGALTEQYVQQQLRAEFGTAPYYWSAGANRAEVDFLFEQDGATVPLEVKAETNLRSKSLRSYVQRFSPPVSVRCSMAPYSRQPLQDGSSLLNIPLFGVSALRAECADALS